MTEPEHREQLLVSDIVKTAHSAETNLHIIRLKITNGICNTSWRTGGFIFLAFADDFAGFLSIIAMTLLRGEIGSL